MRYNYSVYTLRKLIPVFLPFFTCKMVCLVFNYNIKLCNYFNSSSHICSLTTKEKRKKNFRVYLPEYNDYITSLIYELYEYQQGVLRRHPHHISDTVPIYQLMYHLTLEITHRVTLGRVESSHVLKEQLHWARRL